MKTLLLIFVALACSHYGVAQAERELVWTPDTTLYILNRVAFEKIRVIDARATRSEIGWLKTGALNRTGRLVTDDSLDEVLTRYAARLIRTARRQQGELVVVLRNFWLEDRKGGEEIGTVRLRADLFRSTGAASYWHVRSLDTFYETKRGWDVTAALRRQGSQAISDMLIVGSAPRDTAAVYTIDQLTERQSSAKLRWPVFSTATPPPGIYRSLDDFLNLRVQDTGFVMRHNRGANEGPEYSFYYRNARGKQGKQLGPGNCFAIFDGRSWFVAHNYGFSKMQYAAGEYFTALPLKGLTDRSLDLGLSAIAFGAVGVALASTDRNANYAWYTARLDPEFRKFAIVKRIR